MKKKRKQTEKRIKEMVLFLLSYGPLTTKQISWMLFVIDSTYYGQTGKPLFEGIEWIKTKHGPDFRYIKKSKSD
jgi:hypothetical protein